MPYSTVGSSPSLSGVARSSVTGSDAMKKVNLILKILLVMGAVLSAVR
jgi:hypothetical protein